MANPINLIPGKAYSLSLKDGSTVANVKYVNADVQRGMFRFRMPDGETREYPFKDLKRIVLA